jgi:hypothetical protein
MQEKMSNVVVMQTAAQPLQNVLADQRTLAKRGANSTKMKPWYLQVSVKIDGLKTILYILLSKYTLVYKRAKGWSFSLRPLRASPPLQPPPLLHIIHLSSTTLFAGMTGISLHRAMANDFSVVRQFSHPEQLLFCYKSNSTANQMDFLQVKQFCETGPLTRNVAIAAWGRKCHL